MKKLVTIFEQGDVVLIPDQRNHKVDVPKKVEKTKSQVIQEGEHTGHAHRITSGSAEIYGTPQSDRRFLRALKGGAEITHEEHLPVQIEEQDYEIRIVRQKDIFSKIVSKVLD